VFFVALILLGLILNPVMGFSAENEKAAKASPAQSSAEQSGDLPPSEVTLGARAGDGLNEGFGDILAPVFAFKSGISSFLDFLLYNACRISKMPNSEAKRLPNHSRRLSHDRVSP